jgi:hypothetical protein
VNRNESPGKRTETLYKSGVSLQELQIDELVQEQSLHMLGRLARKKGTEINETIPTIANETVEESHFPFDFSGLNNIIFGILIFCIPSHVY